MPIKDSNYDKIPPELRSLPQWLVWKLVPAKPKPKKVPYNPRCPRQLASSTDATKWGTYDESVQTFNEHQFAGIGFVFSEIDPFVGVDLDKCRDPETGALEPWAQHIVEELNSYTEVSPSGTGVHIIVQGQLPKDGRKKGKVEMYESGRFFTMTGQHMADTPLEICERQDALNQLHAETFQAAKPDKPHPINENSPKRTSPPPLDDTELIQKAMNAKNGAKFSALWNGDISPHPSTSEADLAFCSLLAFWTGGDGARMDRLFRQSKLYRDKWDEPRGDATWGEQTIAAACASCTEYYTPFQSSTKKQMGKENEEEKEEGFAKTMADLIKTHDSFAKDAGGLLYHYEGGVYRPTAKDFIKGQFQHLCEARGCTSRWSSHMSKEVLEYISVPAPRLWATPPLDTINVLNGLLVVATHELHPHNPAFLSPVQLPVKFDPEATCPAWEKFIGEVFPEDARSLGYEIPAYLMRPDNSQQKAVLLTGEGENGKSTFLGALSRFIGKDNISTVSLHRLEVDKFAVQRLVGKLANICPDLPSEQLAGSSVFKAITGGDDLEAERKFQDSFSFTPSVRLAFSANHLPQSKDSSQGFFRRWVVVPFHQTIPPANRLPKDILEGRLATPVELSGLLNKALQALPTMKTRGGFTQSESLQAAHREFREMTDPLAIWLDQHMEIAPEDYVSKKDLRIKVNAWNGEQGRPLCTAHALTKAVKRHRPSVQETQRTVAGKVEGVFLGLKLRSASPQSGGVHDFHDFSHSFLNARDSQGQEYIEKEKDNYKSLNREEVMKVVKPASGEDDAQGLFLDPAEVNPWN